MDPSSRIEPANPMSHTLDLAPRSPVGGSGEERSQRCSLKGSNQVQIDPAQEPTKSDTPATKQKGENKPHTCRRRNDQPQKHAAEKEKCEPAGDRAR
jgi:hypothetical protein